MHQMRFDYKTYALPSLHHTDSGVNRRASDMAVPARWGAPLAAVWV